MKRHNVRAPRITLIMLGLATMLAGMAASAASTVELGDIGNDAPNYLWCDKDKHKTLAGGGFMPVFRGRSTRPGGETGSIRIVPASEAYLLWEASAPDSAQSYRFAENMDVLSIAAGITHGVIVRNSTPTGLYYVEFTAIDSTGEGSGLAQGCLIEVVESFPRFAAADFSYDPMRPGATPVVTLTIKNETQPPAAPLSGVPWTIALKLQRGTGLLRQYEYEVLASGMQSNVAPGGTFQAKADVANATRNYNRSTRPIGISGCVDPYNFLGEEASDRSDNCKTISLSFEPPPQQHTCEPGYTEVDTDGGKGCKAPAAPRPEPCKNFFESILGFISDFCSNDTEGWRCSGNAMCSSGNICADGQCVPGHVP